MVLCDATFDKINISNVQTRCLAGCELQQLPVNSLYLFTQ